MVNGQITIGGSVYGGGNAGKVSGNSTVTVRAGDVDKVFGGARMADVEGRAFVNIDGEHASDYILINYVYGGNDISGSIGTGTRPTELTEVVPIASAEGTGKEVLNEGKYLNDIDNSWNAYVRVSRSTKKNENNETVDDKKIYFGQLFGGGNGDYYYSSTTNSEGKYEVKASETATEALATSDTEFSKPNLGKTYLELVGGSIVYAYGGGNNATVTEKTVICFDNPSTVVNEIKVDANGKYDEVYGTDAITKKNTATGKTRVEEKMGINMTYSYPSSEQYQIGSFFGGNNTAEMAIRPEWHIKQGKIRNLYSGGNRGAMTSPEGLLLDIKSPTLYGYTNNDLVIENVYGGCRMADVKPTVNGVYTPTVNLPDYNFPDVFAARLLIKGGTVTNVYGGNDITGKVFGGNALGIYTSIEGSVYGGGNGSYPYTDNKDLTDDAKLTYGDFIYDPDEVDPDGNKMFASSLDALNAYRPNAEQVSLRVWGPSTSNPTVIKGSIYLGGNSATLAPASNMTNPTVELKIGSNVIAENVFLGNNGENMVKTNAEDYNNYIHEGVLRTMLRTDLTTDGSKFSSLTLTNADQFKTYMQGASLDILPSVVFDDEGRNDPESYTDYSSYFGSFYCGGNVGSITKEGCQEIDFNHKVTIFEKLVGGCNQAFVPATDYNARYEGGLIGAPDDDHNKLKLDLSGLLVEPMRWKAVKDDSTYPYNYLEWNTWLDGVKVTPVTELVKDEGKDYRTSDDTDLNRRFVGGNIYGGCNTSGIVNGNVIINIDATIMDRDKLFDVVESDELGDEISLYGEDQTTPTTYHITERKTGVILGQQGMDVLGNALSVFGGGYGKDTEIWGSTTINLNRGYTFQIFGGSAEGVIGKPNETNGTNGTNGTYENGTYYFNGKTYAYSDAYTCTVNMKGTKVGVSKKADSSEDMAEAEFIYGGGFEGPICGNAIINLGKGRIFNSFAGSCNADILGHTETYIGRSGVDASGNDVEGFPWIRDIVYGGNDLGGTIYGTGDFSGRVTEFAENKGYGANGANGATTASAYVEYLQGRADAIFGGCYGTYDYTDDYFREFFNADGTAKPGYSKPYMANAFVNFRPSYSNENNVVNKVYGAGQGYPDDRSGDQLQDRSYVLIDIPQDMTYYTNMEVFGAGSYNGLGMREQYSEGTDVAFNTSAAVIDLLRGQVGAAYGASLNEGVTRHTLVNVPTGSTIRIGSIFGGAYGNDRLKPCDVYDANVEYHSSDAWLVYNPVRTQKEKRAKDDGTEEEVEVTVGNALYKGSIYGGNNDKRRTIYSHIHIDVPVNMNHYQYGNTTGYVYGAGCGAETWAEYSEVELADGAAVYEVYGGGEQGLMLNAESTQTYMASAGQSVQGATNEGWAKAWYIGGGYDPESFSDYASNSVTNLNNTLTGYNNRPLVRTAEMDNRANGTNGTYKYNTNVIIHKGATVNNYAYGGGLGNSGNHATTGSGDIYGTTYIALLGGYVAKDIYAAGTVGAVYNAFGADFTASTNAYIAGGKVRNVYGGGWQGDVGYTPMTYTSDGWDKNEVYDASTEKPGETHVVIGIRKDQTDASLLAELTKVKGSNATLADYGYFYGVPSIERNAYAGGEGGAVFGKSNLVLNNGYIGYRYFADVPTEEDFPYYTDGGGYYQEKINDETYWVNNTYQGDGRLRDCGNVFGGGYDVRSCVDESNVTMWGGVVRNSMHGGGEIATIGRGDVTPSGENNVNRTLDDIKKPGKTTVTMYNGHVRRNVFGGGKGYNLWGYGQQGTLYTDGYVFGQTEVQIHGGEVGTEEGLADGYGNVFGGGDIGFVYSRGYFNSKSRVTGTGSPNHWYYYYDDGNGDNLTEDCKVVIAPELQVKEGSISYGGNTYNAYDYVPTDYLNTLAGKDENKNWASAWNDLIVEDADGNERGVLIHNAVFGGGNVSSNSDTQYANATTVHGNTTATLYDVYHRDFITIGTEHTGGLYGGGNLSLVNGYRELNITNYGTDYYGLDAQITLEEYRTLSNRERAYFQLQYVAKAEVTIGGETYKQGQIVKEEEYLKLIADYGESVRDAFTPYGFCSIYAGRLLNTIQRADLCGVYGSRMVLQGAKDRVADVGEDIQYTINRVGEVSLNQQHSMAGDTDDEKSHGNYFGIYSLVHYMGNLTSDVKFSDPYRYKEGNSSTGATTESTDGTTYYNYKKSCYSTGNPSSKRNYGLSYNQVALASGVFLELTTENSTAETKDYGYITGVVELDLINVKKDQVGGGFVYAKNEHRVPKYYPNKKNVLLSEYNQAKTVGTTEIRDEARTYKRYRYADPAHNTENDPRWADDNWTESTGAYIISGETEVLPYTTMVYETSGNFIHPSKRIVDDCYPTNNAYIIGSSNYSPAHYWYVKGEVYIYDQKVSAYTGAATAYSKAVNLPLTITAANGGKLQLLNVKPNLYAYYTVNKAGEKVKIGTKDTDNKPIEQVWVNNDNDGYTLNEVVTWWDWQQMSYKDRQYFVTNTYVNCVPCTIGGTDYAVGEYVMDETDFTAFKANMPTVTYTNDEGDETTLEAATVSNVFRSSNNVGHDTGYVLTFDMNTPDIWNDYYSKEEPTGSDTDKIRKSDYDDLSASEQNDYREGPTFTPETSGTYGARDITVGDIITEADKNSNKTTGEGAATVEAAYVAKEAVTYIYGGKTKTINAGTAIPASEYTAIDATAKSSFAPAYVSTQTVELAEGTYLGIGELKTAAEIASLKSTYNTEAIDAAMTPAYICSAAGSFGGQTFETGKNSSALTTWCSLSESDRINSDGTYKFNFNYDAFDLLADNDYLKVNAGATTITNPEHSETVSAFRSPYTDIVGVEYQAVFKATTDKTSYTYSGGTLTDGQSIDNVTFESEVRNDKLHYTKVSVKSGGETIYIANDNFVYNGTPYGKGQVVDADVHANNSTYVDAVPFTNTGANAISEYYCYEDYEKADSTTVTKGAVISESDFAALTNDQKYFVIQGKEPTEMTTFYVSKESDIKDVTSERVYTVVYQYTYYEDEDDGSVKLTNELHVINVHIDLQSGAPTIGELTPPGTVLPDWTVGLKAPDVTPGLYEVLTNGWELFNDIDDAEHHRNGSPFTNNGTPVYWYQNQDHYICFYSKTYLGKTYSKPVPLSVANYHDLDNIMNHPEHHLYVDRADVDRPSKIYIDNRECESDATKSELDLLKDFYDLSLLSSNSEGVADGKVTAEGALKDHALLDNHVRAGRNLDFILRSDVSPKAYTTWTPIGSSGTTGDTGECFDGTLHGDGYTISGLSSSLFNYLCGEVYNLGVTGSFTGGGIAETGSGYVENCWIKTTGTPTTGEGHFAVFGDPSRNNDERGDIQVVNCYYPASNAYTAPSSTTHGQATQMPDKAFYNGTVAYNLNGFYLKKRYYDATVPVGSPTGDYAAYNYLPSAADGTLPDNMSTGQYPATYALYQPVGTAETPYLGYVENRFYDGDFIYAGGTVPETNNIRLRTVTTTDGEGKTTTKNYYSPIWPEDYLFFGQRLTYGHVDGRPHQEQPSAINRENERVVTSDVGNRVYRAPAYFRSGTMDVAHFNPAAVFAQTKQGDATVLAYKNMTAIDFTGYHDYNDKSFVDGWATHQPNGANGVYWTKNETTGANRIFFPPLLDDDGLTSFQNVDLTRNLLVYTGTDTDAATLTNDVVSGYLKDETYLETDDNYHTVDPWDSPSDAVKGHWVQQTSAGTYTAQRDHMLVDKQDFNAPIGYTFGSDYRMWYQRVPDNYVGKKTGEATFIDSNAGWEGISLPFKAEIVTTDEKGEITHFYRTTSGGSGAGNLGRIGHEYWLREFTGIAGTEGTTVKATLTYPAASSTDGEKEYSNTFLWDYYYSYNGYDDQNNDDYQEKDNHRTYYKQGREYPDYPRLAAATPYIIGFPGERYYEFDLSGTFSPKNTDDWPSTRDLKKQTITFASKTGATIAISDSETGVAQTYSGKTYTFKPSYLNETFEAGTADTYTLSATGNSYDVVPAPADEGEPAVNPVTVNAFRPYFTSKSSGSSRKTTRSIVFSGDGADMPHQAYDADDPGTISAYAGKHKIIVISTLKVTTDVRIVNTAGQVMATFPIKSGETVETRINSAGVYIVQDEEGKYVRKIAVE